MAQGIFDPDEKGTAAALGNESAISSQDSQADGRTNTQNLQPDHRVSAVRLRAKNGDLDKFRHLFGPKRMGR